MKKILVLGSNGMLGYGVSEYFRHSGLGVESLTRNEFDVLKQDIALLNKPLRNSDLVVNCIGVIKPTIEKYDPLDVIKINGIFPRNLARICKANKTPLIHVSTDCTFSGKKGRYNENDLFDADDLYGISKNCGDICECMTLKTSFVGPEKNTKRSLLEWAFSQKGKTISGFTNHFWNGVTTIQFAQIIEKIINQNLYREGLFHIYSPDTVTKFELVNLFNEIFSLNMHIKPVEAKEFCDRSLYSVYELSSKVSDISIKDQLINLKEFFKLNSI